MKPDIYKGKRPRAISMTGGWNYLEPKPKSLLRRILEYFRH